MLAALAPQMLALAGEQTDGTVLWMTGPATVRDYVVPAIRPRPARRAAPPRVVCILPVCVTDDPDAARAPPPRSSRSTGSCPPTARCWTGRARPARDVAIVGDEGAVAAQILALADGGVTDFVAVEYAGGPP